jgi:mitochondrial enoyl-[acyl-carrier protein] reductase / trans-2-enoyl-CoA reductase
LSVSRSGVVVKVGPGCKKLAEGDWVVPLAPHCGTWRSLSALKERDLFKIPTECMPLEQAALLREMVGAYRMLEEAALKPGDCVILNAANGTVGQLVVQLCRLLRLRAVAIVSDASDFEKTSLWLRALGAAEVLLDAGSIRVSW